MFGRGGPAPTRRVDCCVPSALVAVSVNSVVSLIVTLVLADPPYSLPPSEETGRPRVSIIVEF